MKIDTFAIRSGFDGKRCFVHARCCEAPGLMVATSQYLDVDGCDFFSGIYSSVSTDGGRTWSEFKEEAGLAPVREGNLTTVVCDGTPMYHKASGKVLVIGHTAEYEDGIKHPTGRRRYTFYSVYDRECGSFSKAKFVKMPEGFESCGNGCGQSVELENGDLLIPVYYIHSGETNYHVTVMRCSFDGEEMTYLEHGRSMTVEFGRGFGEPSVIYHDGVYRMCIRHDECGLLAKSTDGLNYTDLQLLKWDDGSIVQNYNTQQHFMKVGGDLYLVYTRRAGNNDRVFRHRAPLFAAKVENMRLVRDSEIVLTPERGARCGNFGAISMEDGRGMVMVTEWMQPVGCEKYGSDNSIFVSFVGK